MSSTRGLITRLSAVVVGVPDRDATARFLSDVLGFAVTRTAHGDTHTVVCSGDYGPCGQGAIELVSRPQLELLRTRLAVGDLEVVPKIAQALDRLGVASTLEEGALLFSDPAGNALAVCGPEDALVDLPEPNALRPRRLGHVNLKSPDPASTAAFYEQIGLRLSEQIGEHLYFLRFGTEHHNIGLRPGARGELHHLGFEIDGWHLYQPILDRLASFGASVEYGPGRHTPGNNLFAYLREPTSGLRLELFADMGRIADPDAHKPVRWEAGDRMSKTINRWGPTPPESFLA